MGRLTNVLIDAAAARGEQDQRTKMRAAHVRYDPDSRRVVIDLANGCTFAFPPSLTQGLETASDEELANVEILGAGTGLHWEALDVDFSVPGLLSGLLGTKAYLAGRAGMTTSPAKAAAARANGARGGRPSKLTVTS